MYENQIRLTNIPIIEPIIYTIPRRVKFSFMFLFDLNNITNAIPELVNRPANNEPKDKALFKYNSVIITDAPQFGISPISDEINGPKIEPCNNILLSSSSNPNSNTAFNTILIITTNKAIFRVCFKLDRINECFLS